MGTRITTTYLRYKDWSSIRIMAQIIVREFLFGGVDEKGVEFDLSGGADKNALPLPLKVQLPWTVRSLSLF